MSNTKYIEYLKDQRWYYKRKIIILRDEKKCTVCGIKKNLQVHHTFYYTDYREPWRYPDESLLTLCKPCHNKYHEEHDIEYKSPLEIKVKQKNKGRIKRKGKKKRKEFRGYREKRVSLLSIQAKRLGYEINRFGKWEQIAGSK